MVGLTIDHFGLLGVGRTPLDFSRVLGVILMLSGLYFVLRQNL
ncbi:MAG: DMT family transporter [Desulfitobacterium hafniense]